MVVVKGKEASVRDNSVPAKNFKKASCQQYDDRCLQFGLLIIAQVKHGSFLTTNTQ